MDQSPQQTPNPDPTPPDPAALAALARKRKWDRITWIVVIAMIALWGTAMIFRDTIRANYWAWRLSFAPAEPDRTVWINSLIGLGDAKATGPAIRLTRNEQADARLAGLRVLVGLLDQQRQRQKARIQAYLDSGKGTLAHLPKELMRPLQVDPRTVQRFRELLDDPSPEVQLAAIDGIRETRDAQAVDQLAALAIGSTDTRVADAAVVAIDGIPPDPAAGAALRDVLAKSPGADVRAQAIESLEEHRSRATVQAVADALADSRPVTIRPASANDQLMGAIKMHFAEMGKTVGGRRRPTSEPVSQPVLDEPDPVTVADYAARMLGEWTGQPLGLISGRPAAERAKIIQQYRQAAAEYKGE